MDRSLAFRSLTISPWRLILGGLRYHWRVHLSVMLAVAVATAVITGALFVGDSVRGSLGDLALARLGRIEHAIRFPRPVGQGLVETLKASPLAESSFGEVIGLLMLPGSVEHQQAESTVRAGDVTMIGCPEAFWSLGKGGPETPLRGDAIALTAVLAAELNVAVGDEVVLRLPLSSQLPADSLLGEKRDSTIGKRVRVDAVLQPEGLARFGLHPSQQLPRNVFVPLATLQRAVFQDGNINQILLTRRESMETSSASSAADAIEGALAGAATLADYGVNVARIQRGAGDEAAATDAVAPEAERQPVADYIHITYEGLMLPERLVVAAEEAFAEGSWQKVMTYLANTIATDDRKIPYSLISAVDSSDALGPLRDDQDAAILLQDDEIALTNWASDDLEVRVADRVSISYYEPESTHGKLVEQKHSLEIRAIVPLAAEDGVPTLAGDPNFTPKLEGVTDRDSIENWDVPFDLVERVRDKDEAYWTQYTTTPKAFVSFDLGRRLWKSHWGDATSLRAPAGGQFTVANVEEQLHSRLRPADFGIAVLPLRAQALASAQGTTPFEGLFLGFSFFLILAAVMLIALLFRLGIDARASELGILVSVGTPTRRVARILAGEGLLVAAVGASIGLLLGLGYAWLMLAGLRTLWVEAIVTPFLVLHTTPKSAAIGVVVGIAVSQAAILWSVWRAVGVPATRLLAGEASAPATGAGPRRRWSRVVAIAGLLLAVGLGLLGSSLRGEAQAGAFLGSGAMVLGAFLLLLGDHLRQRGTVRAMAGRSLWGLAAANAARRPGRSVLTIGLVASASFLIVALSAFRLRPSEEGTGGFHLIAQSAVPLYYDLNTPEGRAEFAFSDAEDEILQRVGVYSFRIRQGEDASCLNLYQTLQPTVLGAPPSFRERGGFAWAATQRRVDNPWMLLTADRPRRTALQQRVPVVLDANTATYSLKLAGVGADVPLAGQSETTGQVAGLLKNSVLQGVLVIGEEDFLDLYPRAEGSRFFLIECDDASAAGDVADLLETRLSDFGFDVVRADERLASLLAVQNTYLSTFQSLGALGLLLGTFGLATVQLRSALERRGELALLRAAGFPRRRLAALVFLENGVLLLGGLAVGVAAAAVALLPHLLGEGASIPWPTLAGMLTAVAVAGLVAGAAAVRVVLRAPLLPALRGN